jgi:hypothetical protein
MTLNTAEYLQEVHTQELHRSRILIKIVEAVWMKIKI